MGQIRLQNLTGNVRLEYPLFHFPVMLPHFSIKLPRNTTDSLLVADIGESQAATGHTTNLVIGAHHHDIRPHLSRGIGRHNSGGRSAIDANIIAAIARGQAQEGKPCHDESIHHFAIL